MKTALITGGNRGIGRAIALGLMPDHRVVIASRDGAAGRAAAADLGCEAVQLDLMQPDSFAAAFAPIGGVDVLINNAGVKIETNMLDDPAGFHASMQVMLHAPYELIRLCGPIWRRKAGAGSSIWALTGAALPPGCRGRAATVWPRRRCTR